MRRAFPGAAFLFSGADMDDRVTIRQGDWPAEAGLIVDLHMRGYASEDDRFSVEFGRHVAETLEDARANAGPASRVWFAEAGGERIGCTAMIDRGERGQLRWVVLLPEARGLGAGRALFETAMSHAREQGWSEVYLETTDGLEASMAMYIKAGFSEMSNEELDLWHGPGRLIVMSKQL